MGEATGYGNLFFRTIGGRYQANVRALFFAEKEEAIKNRLATGCPGPPRKVLLSPNINKLI